MLECKKRKFKKESYIMAKGSLAFKKYPALQELELRHSVELGQAYRSKYSAKVFIHYIAEIQCQHLLASLLMCRFYSFLMEGSTDKAKGHSHSP